MIQLGLTLGDLASFTHLNSFDRSEAVIAGSNPALGMDV
jgi:hypothetical protein